jgi:uncharacterized cupin superfamily protein
MGILFQDAKDAPIGEWRPKATAIEAGQVEASKLVWSEGETGRSIRTGIWEATPGSFTSRRDGHHEIDHILAGRATIIPEDGNPIELGPGDVFITPAGWVGVWHIHETLRKMFVVADA